MVWAAARPNHRGESGARRGPISLPQVHQRVMHSTMTPKAVYSSSLVPLPVGDEYKTMYNSNLMCKHLMLYKTLEQKARLLTCSMMPMSSAACDSCTPMVRLTLKESPVARCIKAKIYIIKAKTLLSDEEQRPVAHSPALALT